LSAEFGFKLLSSAFTFFDSGRFSTLENRLGDIENKLQTDFSALDGRLGEVVGGLAVGGKSLLSDEPEFECLPGSVPDFWALDRRLAADNDSILSLQGRVESLSKLEPRLGEMASRLAADDTSLSPPQGRVESLSGSVSEFTTFENRLRHTERSLSHQKSNTEQLLSGAEDAMPSFGHRHQGFAHPTNREIFRVLVVARSIDHCRAMKLIDLAEGFDSAVCFEFGQFDIESKTRLPAETHGILNCGCEIPSDWSLPTVRIRFVDPDCGFAEVTALAKIDISVDLRTGKGVDQALAALFCGA
jgi:hypothetical protein